MKNDCKDFILLTGATGLLGQYLLRDLLRRGHRMAVVIRSGKRANAAERLEQTMQMWERQAGTLLRRPVCLEGDITCENLGFDETTMQWVANHVGTMLHCAASLTFRPVGDEPWRTNLEGTRNVLELCRATRISDMHYVSTAYVCGEREDMVREDELDVGQVFRNVYEQSKFEAEKAVRNAGFRQTTVYRPVVITGDSSTGYTSTYHGTYLYMKLAKLLAGHVEPSADGKRYLNIRWGLTGHERRNITCVDWNSEIICQLYENPEAHGKTFHLTPAEPISMREAIDYANEFYGLAGVDFRGFKDQPDSPLNDMEKWLWANVSIYGSYDFMDPHFDATNLKRFAPTPVCPKLDRETVRRLIQFAEEDRWGKRKPDPIQPAALCVESYFAQRCPLQSTGIRTAPVTSVGLELLGPGGGPWCLELDSDGILLSYARGLPDATASPIVALPIDLLKLLDDDRLEAADKLERLLNDFNLNPVQQTALVASLTRPPAECEVS